MQKIILDTDIGDDVDDVLALGLVLSSPEFELSGVTTVFRNAFARTRQARTVLKIAGREDVPVSAGCGASISPHVDIPDPLPLKACLDGVLPNQDSTSLPDTRLPELNPAHGVDFIIDAIMQGEGDISIVTIGAMTNLAMALVKEPRIISKIPKIVAMAGFFEEQKAEWNIRCDPVAAEIVSRSGIPVDFIGLDVTLKVKLSEKHLEQLKSSKTPLARKISESITIWRSYVQSIEPDRKEPILPVMHDPLAVATMIDSSIVEWRTGEVSVELNKDKIYGLTVFQEKDNGLHRYAYKVNSEAMISLWMERIM